MLIVAGAFWFGTYRADQDWRPVADRLQSSNATLATQVKELKTRPVPICEQKVCPQVVASPPAAAPSAPGALVRLRRDRCRDCTP
jgi:hypothetical protein